MLSRNTIFNYISAVSVHENREFFPSAQSGIRICNDVIIFIFESQRFGAV